MPFFWFLRNREGQVIDLIFMGRLTPERSQIQERSEGALTAGVWAGGAGIAPWLGGEKQGEVENKGQREGRTVAAVSWAPWGGCVCRARAH